MEIDAEGHSTEATVQRRPTTWHVIRHT